MSATSSGTTRTAPGNAELDAAFRHGMRAEFRAHPSYDGAPLVLLAVVGAELASLHQVLRLNPGPGPHCMCAGDMELVIFGHQQQAAVITLHHGYTIRWRGPWEWNDAELADPDAFIRWLAARGVTQYADEEARRLVADRERERQRERWLAAAPQYLREWLPALEATPTGMPRRLTAEDVADCLAVLRATVGTDDEIAIALLRWFGSGNGPWSGFPCYEDVPESLLLALGTKRLVSAVATATLDEPTLGGLARYFGSYEHRKKRRVDLRSVPLELRQRMTALLERQGAEGNIEYLRSAIRFAERSQANKNKSAVSEPAKAVPPDQTPPAATPSAYPATGAAGPIPELVPPRAPDEVLGDHRLVALSCGNYGEDELTAWRLKEESGDGHVVLSLRSGGRWRVDPIHVLEVDAEGWVAKNYIAIDTKLFLRDSHRRLITHFEMDIMWGGVHDEQVAAFARQVASEAGCAVDIHEMRTRDTRNG